MPRLALQVDGGVVLVRVVGVTYKCSGWHVEYRWIYRRDSEWVVVYVRPPEYKFYSKYGSSPFALPHTHHLVISQLFWPVVDRFCLLFKDDLRG